MSSVYLLASFKILGEATYFIELFTWNYKYHDNPYFENQSLAWEDPENSVSVGG